VPNEFGGTGGSIEKIKQEWRDKIYANRQFLIEQTTLYGVDEKKRVGKPKTQETIFGIEGSFRQLQFD
jgi:hypothetical protein